MLWRMKKRLIQRWNIGGRCYGIIFAYRSIEELYNMQSCRESVQLELLCLQMNTLQSWLVRRQSKLWPHCLACVVKSETNVCIARAQIIKLPDASETPDQIVSLCVHACGSCRNMRSWKKWDLDIQEKHLVQYVNTGIIISSNTSVLYCYAFLYHLPFFAFSGWHAVWCCGWAATYWPWLHCCHL